MNYTYNTDNTVTSTSHTGAAQL